MSICEINAKHNLNHPQHVLNEALVIATDAMLWFWQFTTSLAQRFIISLKLRSKV